MIVMAAASCGMLAATFCVDDVRERRIVTETAMKAVVGLIHQCSEVYDIENAHDRTAQSALFITAGVVKGGRNSWRLHTDSVVLLQFKRPADDALAVRAIADSTEYYSSWRALSAAVSFMRLTVPTCLPPVRVRGPQQ